MFVYIDNNVLIDHEEGKKMLPILPQVQYVYSYVHIEEMLELGDKLAEKKDKRISIIANLTHGNYVCNNNNCELIFSKEDPLVMYYNIVNNPIYQMLTMMKHECFSNWEMDKSPKYFIDRFRIDKKVINNYSPEQIVEKYNDSLIYYIESNSQNRIEAFQSLFDALDMLGFWQDNIGKAMSRSYDANHAYHASICDYFITNDKNTRNKANVSFRYWGYKTHAISYGEFLKLFMV